MSKAPEVCLYCDQEGNSKAGGPCGFCIEGKPLDSQKDWDNSWGKVMNDIDYIFVCPSRHQPGPHKVTWNSGQPYCLSCSILAVAVNTPHIVSEENE